MTVQRDDKLSPRQFAALAFVSALSPLVRRFPRTLAALAGRGALAAVGLSTLFMLPLLAGARLLFRKRPAGTGAAAALTDILGRPLGRGVTGLYGLWFLCYAGFLLRSGAERFCATVYPGADCAVFVAGMALLGALAAAHRTAPLGRAAMLLRPVMLGLILAVAALTLKDLDPTLLLPMGSGAPGGLMAAALETANLLSVIFFLGFLGDRLTGPLRARTALPWLAALLGVVALMTLGCLGMFGPALTARLRYPYFMLVRDMTVLGALERAEPLVLALWVFPDFLFLSLLLQLAAGCLRFALGLRRGGPWLPVACAGAAVAAALALPGALDAMEMLSEVVVPRLCAGFAFAPLPVLLIVGRARGKL